MAVHNFDERSWKYESKEYWLYENKYCRRKCGQLKVGIREI